jgi:hypothetical protein
MDATLSHRATENKNNIIATDLPFEMKIAVIGWLLVQYLSNITAELICMVAWTLNSVIQIAFLCTLNILISTMKSKAVITFNSCILVKLSYTK